MYKKYLKRTFDTLVSTIVLLMAMPVGVVVFLLSWLDSNGPVIFKQHRTGLHGLAFCMYKFRTMSSDNNVYDKNKINQVTKLGKIIRSLSIDEIPQLINIIKGDMSLIGPRPWIPEYYQNMNETQRMRVSVRPGITGLAQVRGRNNLDVIDKIKFDLEYIQKITFINDLKIISLTLSSLFEKTGAAIEKHAIHHEIYTLQLQHSLKFPANDLAFFSEIRSSKKELNRIRRRRRGSDIKPVAVKNKIDSAKEGSRLQLEFRNGNKLL